MAGLLPPVIATLLADTKEYTAKMDESIGKMEELGAASDTTGGKFGSFASRASTAVIGVGVALGAYAVDKAVKFQDALDKVQNTTNVTAQELKHISSEAFKVSDATGQSAVNIVGAYGAVEAAGYKRAAADKAVAAAAKLTLIAGGDVVANTQSLIAAQNLGITKGMSAAKVADLLTIALKGNEGGLSGVVSLLSGKVGAAFAGYHQSAGEAVAVSNEFSKAGITQTRQIATFVQKLGALQGPMETTSVQNGKLTTSSAGYVNSLVDVGLNVDKTKQAFTGPDGLVNGLKYLKTAADGSLPKLQQYLTAIFGATGVGSGMALINNLSTLTKTVNAANHATPAGLNTAANTAASQLDNQLKIIEQRLENAATKFGLTLLPYVKDAANDLIKAMDYLDKHPAILSAAFKVAAGIFAAAVGYKLASAVQSIWGSLNSKVQTGLLDDIAGNTSLMVKELGGRDVTGGAGDVGLGAGELTGAAALGGLSGAVVIGVAGGISGAFLDLNSKNPNASASARGSYNQATMGGLFNGTQKIQVPNFNATAQTVMVNGNAVTLSGNEPGVGGGGANLLPKPQKSGKTKVSASISVHLH